MNVNSQFVIKLIHFDYFFENLKRIVGNYFIACNQGSEMDYLNYVICFIGTCQEYDIKQIRDTRI